MCTQCSQPMETPLCCASCGALNPQPPSMFTYFELFSMEPTYDVDPGELRRKYLGLSRSIHPDMAGRDSEAQRRQSLALSSGLNRAYETLRNPVEPRRVPAAYWPADRTRRGQVRAGRTAGRSDDAP